MVIWFLCIIVSHIAGNLRKSQVALGVEISEVCAGKEKISEIPSHILSEISGMINDQIV